MRSCSITAGLIPPIFPRSIVHAPIFHVLLAVVAGLVVNVAENNAFAADDNDIPSLLKKIQSFNDEGNYVKAMQEMEWLSKELERRHFAATQNLLPKELMGHKCGDAEISSAMGFSSVELTCTKDKEKVKLILSGITSAGGNSGFSALGKMALLANQNGSDTKRIDGRTARVRKLGKGYELTLFLESNSVLKLQGRDVENQAVLEKMVGEVDLGNLDNYLKGDAPAKIKG